MTEASSRAPERPGSPPGTDGEPPAPEPSFWQTMKWAMVMLGITLLFAAITIPVLLWFE